MNSVALNTAVSQIPQPDIPDLQQEMFIFGYRKELRTMRCLQYLYERNTRIYWNRIFRPEDVDETFHYYNTENCIFEEVDDHIDTGDLEFAFYRASGPIVR